MCPLLTRNGSLSDPLQARPALKPPGYTPAPDQSGSVSPVDRAPLNSRVGLPPGGWWTALGGFFATLRQSAAILLLGLLLAACQAQAECPAAPTCPACPTGITCLPTASPYPPPPASGGAAPAYPGPTIPTVPSRPTPTPAPTFTPGLPTPTPTPTSIPSPTPTVPVITPAGGQLPKLPADLMYISTGRLQWWDHRQNQIRQIAGPPASVDCEGQSDRCIIDYAASADGSLVVARQPMTGPDETYAMLMIEPYQGISRTLNTYSTQGFGLLGLDVSPDGQWAAYIPQDIHPTPTFKPPGPAMPRAGGGLSSGRVILVQRDQPEQLREIGQCGAGCGGLRFSPDNRQVAWGSVSGGIWLARPGETPRQIVKNIIEWPFTPAGGGTIWLKIESWSPRSTRLLVHVYGGAGQGYYYSVEAEDGQATYLDSAWSTISASEVAWLDDERLVFLRSGGIDPKSIFYGTIRRAAGAPGQQAPWGGSFSIPGEFPSQALAPAMLGLSQIGFAVGDFEPGITGPQRGLYAFDMARFQVVRLNDLPVTQTQPSSEPFGYWAPDGSGLLLQAGYSGLYLYVPADGGPLIDLAPFVGQAGQFTWLQGRPAAGR